MVTINSVLNTAITSLRTHTIAINTVTHNIANMNNEWYSRQLANISATDPLSFPGIAGQIGTGSKISFIERIRDIFLDKQMINERQYIGYWDVQNKIYESLKAVFPEIYGVTSGFDALLQEFYDEWEQLAVAADKAETETDATIKLQYQEEVETAKRKIYQTAEGIANYFNSKYSTLTNMQIELTKDLRLTVNSINEYLKQIYEYNKQIKNIYASGQNPNDILDKRNEAMNNLAELINYDFATKADGSVVILLGGYTLVNGGDGYNRLATMGSMRDSKLEDVGILIGNSNTPVKINENITGGQLGGILTTRDNTLHWFKVQLDNLANSMVTVINKIFRTGLDADGNQIDKDFFIGTRAADIIVNPQLMSGADIVYKHFGTNDIADIIANLENKVVNNWLTTQSLAYSSSSKLGRNGSLQINGIKINYFSTETIADLVKKINTNVSEVSAIFDDTMHKFNIYSNQLITITEFNPDGTVAKSSDSSCLLNKFLLREEKVSSGPANYTGTLLKNIIDLSSDTWRNDNLIFNMQPTERGTVVINYNGGTYEVSWNDLQLMIATIGNIVGSIGMSHFGFDANSQKFSFATSSSSNADAIILPFIFNDKIGNLVQTMNITENIKFGEYYSIIVGRLKGELETSQNILQQHNAALEIYHQLQENITKVNEDEEMARAKEYQRAYDASVRLLSIIDQMLNM
ncbi:MAG: flagellar hook-associated protein FlgK, partial [Candidatus Goldbacteria bacterium]|nr:flagellar hook-associated protein FlgK [Candidatus Goldiibacteriota bacterium]